MRKAQLRQEVAEYLGSVGYAPDSHGWVRVGRRVVCRVMVQPDAKLSHSVEYTTASCFVDLHLPAGTSRRALNELLATIPTIGPPRAVGRYVDTRPAVNGSLEF